jgi:hypothetical protein
MSPLILTGRIEATSKDFSDCADAIPARNGTKAMVSASAA